jgi:hypothetical protein
MYPLMMAGFIPPQSFHEYKSALLTQRFQRQYSNKTFREIEAEMAAVVAAYEGR